jgi:hypothetical protein
MLQRELLPRLNRVMSFTDRARKIPHPAWWLVCCVSLVSMWGCGVVEPSPDGALKGQPSGSICYSDTENSKEYSIAGHLVAIDFNGSRGGVLREDA